MKKGFTLIEIIISVVLIIAVGTTSTIILLNTNNKNEEIENITKQILEAANAFINVEKDEFGNTYKNGISRGGKGVQLSVQNLIDKGYLEDNQITTLEKYTDLDSTELYILAAITVLNESECGENVIEYTASWYEDSEEPIYLCGYKSDGTGTLDCPPTFLEEYYQYDDNPILEYEDISIDNYYVQRANECESYAQLPIENGIFRSKSEIDSERYDIYYRGEIYSNYVDIDGIIFRIVWNNGDVVALITENAIPSKYYLNAIATAEMSKMEDAVNDWYLDLTENANNNLDITTSLFVTLKYSSGLEIKYSFLSYEQAIKAGIAPSNSYISHTNCYYNFSGGKYFRNWDGSEDVCSNPYVNTSWLTSGSSFILAPIFDSIYYDAIINSIRSNGGSYTIGGDVFIGWYNTQTKQGMENGIRPVIYINAADVVYSGKGTREEPYVIKGAYERNRRCYE